MHPPTYSLALEDFQRARRKAAMEQLLARFSGRSADLLSYEELRQQLRVVNQAPRGLQEIPLDKIIGSVGRYKDFTRSFLPRQDSIEHRWAKVKTAVHDLTGVPAIEVYQLGDAYFVIDGNHRVSVAREMGLPTISAYVTEVKTRVPLSADDDPEEIICKARYAEFLEQTNLDKIRPGADLLMTFCGQYRLIWEHITVHRHYLGLEQQRYISEEEAIASWYDHVYLPVIQIIREQGILRYFPGHTEADMYVLLAEHRAELTGVLGWEVSPETAVSQLTKEKRSPIQALLEAVVPAELGSGPPPGVWRAELVRKRPSGRLFDDILIPMGAHPADWRVLDMGIGIARLGQSRLLGLHVVDEDNPSADAIPTEAIRAEFEQRCQAAGVQGQFAVEWGSVAAKIVQRSVYADGIVLPINHPPETVADRYTSGLQFILRHCPRPILTAPPGEARPLTHALLAYGGGQTPAQEALFVAAYLAAHYQIRLSVISVGDNIQTNRALAQVREYLQQAGVTADFYAETGEVVEVIQQTAVNAQADFLIIGGFAYSPLRTLLRGSIANRMLLTCNKPLLICR
ncbi:MAG TPA: universal stress protein [Chloroflexota bacterium]|nr:universal stress protein [Chloroflexota bacterium]